MRPLRSSVTALATLCSLPLCGCVVQPARTEILVVTTPPGASCTLTRLGQPIATVAPTPAIALTDPGSGEITVHCSRQGFADAETTLPALESRWDYGALYGRPAANYQYQADIVLVPRAPGTSAR